MEAVLVFTDGACFPNPGKGAWGVVIVEPDGNVRKLNGRATGQTTSSRMEMTAVLMALRALSQPGAKTILHSDSQFVIRCLRGRYRRSKNLSLWAEIDVELKRFTGLSFEWVKGHAGNKYNEIADQLANEAAGLRDGRPYRGQASAEQVAHGFWGEVGRLRYEQPVPKRGLKCNRCRQPMRPLVSSRQRAKLGEHWFRCDACHVSAYKDSRGAHYVSAKHSGLKVEDCSDDPFAITAPVDPIFQSRSSTWRRKHRRSPRD